MSTTSISRFTVHDELTAPEGSAAVLRGALAAAGQLPNVLGVLAGAPAALRGYARFRGELRRGHLGRATLERLALAVSEHYGSRPGLALHTRTARSIGLRLDEIARARRFESADPVEAALLHYLHELIAVPGPMPQHVHEQAREAGWTEEQLLEAIAFVAVESLTAMVNVAGDVPPDGSLEESRQLRAA